MLIIVYIVISLVISLSIALFKLFLMIKSKRKIMTDSSTFYVFNLFLSLVIYEIAELVNVLECYESQLKPICVITWEVFQVSSQVTLSWVTVLCFTMFFVLSTNTQDFMDILQKANKEFLICCWLVPLVINMSALIDYVSDSDRKINITAQNVRVFSVSLTPDQFYSVVIPNLILLVLCMIFSIFSFSFIRNSGLTPNFKGRIKDEQRVLLAGLGLIYIPYFSFEIAGVFTTNDDTLNTICQYHMIIFNLLLPIVYFYIYGINTSINQIILLKTSMGRSIHESHLDVSITCSTHEKTITSLNLDRSTFRKTKSSKSNQLKVESLNQTHNLKSDIMLTEQSI